jgi:signal transduction histidine kinase
MPDLDRDSPASAVLKALGFALFVKEEPGALRLQGTPPEWMRSLWPGLTRIGMPLPIEQASPFLENFLIDAAECWTAGGETRAQSGPWVEQTTAGAEITLEATAFTAGGRAVLLLERLGEGFEAKKSILQKARETAIAYQRLNSEMQKKEILLSCIAEEMNSALANAITSLRLIELEKNSPRTRQLLNLATRAAEDQQVLINKVLNVFAAELKELFGHDGADQAEASLGKALRAAEEMVESQFAERRIALRVDDNGARGVRVAMDPDHLGRVIVSLLENSLQNATTGGEVRLNLVAQPESILIQVLDSGAPLPPRICESVFSKKGALPVELTPAQLRLQFCRIAVEKSQGEIGYEPNEKGGNCFWIRVPKSAAAK